MAEEINYSPDFLQNFDFLWEVIIYPIIQKANEEIELEFRKEAHLQFAFNDLEKYKKELIRIYHEKRVWLKGMYLPHEGKPLLDTHKLGAILCRSMIANKVFYFDYDSAEKYILHKFENSKTNNLEWFIDNVYINYKLAFYASVGMVFIELLHKYEKEGKMDAFDSLKRRGHIVFYQKSLNHDSFVNSCILALQKNDVLKRNFDYLTYAALLFQLEEYNRAYFAQTIAVLT